MSPILKKQGSECISGSKYARALNDESSEYTPGSECTKILNMQLVLINQVFWICLRFWICQGSENAPGSE